MRVFWVYRTERYEEDIFEKSFKTKEEAQQFVLEARIIDEKNNEEWWTYRIDDISNRL